MSSTHTTQAAVQPFAVVRRGFDRDQVTAALSRLEAEAELLRADRDAAVARAERALVDLELQREHRATLEARVAELGKAPVTSEQMSDRVSTMLGLASAEAASIRDAAHTTADQVLNQAEEDAWRMRESAASELSDIRSRTAKIRAEHTSVLEAARTRAAEIVRAADQRARMLDEDAAQHRKQIDDDHRLASDARRLESLREERARQAASLRAADELRRAAAEDAACIVDDARTRASEMIAVARTHTEHLRHLRRDVLADLAAIQARLEPVPSTVDEEPLPDSPSFSSSDG